jgi:hypothetical protein
MVFLVYHNFCMVFCPTASTWLCGFSATPHRRWVEFCLLWCWVWTFINKNLIIVKKVYLSLFCLYLIDSYIYRDDFMSNFTKKKKKKTSLIISYMYFHGVYKSTIFHVIIFVCSLSINRHPNYSINSVQGYTALF